MRFSKNSIESPIFPMLKGFLRVNEGRRPSASKGGMARREGRSLIKGRQAQRGVG